MRSISIDILGLFGLLMALLGLFVSWLWMHTASISTASIDTGFIYIIQIIIIGVFVAILLRKD